MSSVTILLSSLSNGIRSNMVRLKICNISYELADKLSHFLTMATITTAADIRKNRELILRFTKAYIEGTTA